MPRSRSAQTSTGNSWSASDIINRYGTSNLKLSYTNPAFDIGRINNHGHLQYQNNTTAQHVAARFQVGDYVVAKRFKDGKRVRGRIVSIQNREGYLDRMYIIVNGRRVRVDVATVEKLSESVDTRVLSFGEFVDSYVLNESLSMTDEELYSMTPLELGEMLIRRIYRNNFDRDFLHRLLALGPIFTKTKYGETALHFSVSSGELWLVEMLVKAGADVNAIDNDRISPLDVAARINEFDIAEFLINANANVHLQNRHGYTPLHTAASHGNDGICELLIKAGADVNARTANGHTPLHNAASMSGSSSSELEGADLIRVYKRICKMLVKAGTDVDAKDNRGSTAFDIVAPSLRSWFERNILNTKSA